MPIGSLMDCVQSASVNVTKRNAFVSKMKHKKDAMVIKKYRITSHHKYISFFHLYLTCVLYLTCYFSLLQWLEYPKRILQTVLRVLLKKISAQHQRLRQRLPLFPVHLLCHLRQFLALLPPLIYLSVREKNRDIIQHLKRRLQYHHFCSILPPKP